MTLDADAATIRAAYHERARMHHPDRASSASSAEMAAVNEAYRVLGDAGRRAAYDRTLVGHRSRAERLSPSWTAGESPPPVAPLPPARIPWKLMAAMAVVGVAVVIAGAALIDPPAEQAPDGLLRPGSCVEIEANGDAREVNCTDGTQLLVDSVVSLDEQCPAGTTGYRDRQGLGTACVVEPAN